MIARFFVAFIVVMLSASCDRSSNLADRRGPDITETGNTRIIVNHQPSWRDGEEWTVSSDPALTIGVGDGDPEYLFDQVRGITRLSTGEIVVLNAGDGQLRYYTAAGQYIRAVGRNGDGPGEMRAPRLLSRLNNDVLQVTHAGGRLRFGPDGNVVADYRINWGRIHEVSRRAAPAGSAGFLMESCGIPTPVFFDDSVLLCASRYTDVRFLPDKVGRHEVVELVARADELLEIIDTIGIFNVRSLIVYVQGGRHLPIFIGPPYGPRGRMRTGGRPTQLVYTPAEAYRIEIYSLQTPGRRVIIERAGGLRPLTQFDRESFDRAFTAPDPYNRLRRRPNPSEFRHLVTPVDSLSIIASAPYIDELNAVWAPLEPYGTFDVFDAHGVYLGRVSIPSTFRIHEIGFDYILDVTTDAFDVEYVVMYRLNRSRRAVE
jgi:hypothetical protein